MTVLDIIKSRESVREFKDQPIPQDVLDRILEAGLNAPTARNRQRIRVIAVTDEALRAPLSEACRKQPSVQQAPVSFVVCADQDLNMACGQSTSSVDCSIALSFMYLAATEEGLGGCWLGAFDAQKVAELLGIPEDYVVVAVMPVGYPASPMVCKDRKPMEEFVSYNKF